MKYLICKQSIKISNIEYVVGEKYEYDIQYESMWDCFKNINKRYHIWGDIKYIFYTRKTQYMFYETKSHNQLCVWDYFETKKDTRKRKLKRLNNDIMIEKMSILDKYLCIENFKTYNIRQDYDFYVKGETYSYFIIPRNKRKYFVDNTLKNIRALKLKNLE
jgi:hypothetical protein